MTASDGFIELLRDLLAPLGPIRVKRMFGGAGIFADDRMFALVADDTLYFKVDGHNEQDFEREDLERFGYEGKGRRMEMSYRRAPERIYDDQHEMCDWARGALAAAHRSGTAKTKTAAARTPRKRAQAKTGKTDPERAKTRKPTRKS